MRLADLVALALIAISQLCEAQSSSKGCLSYQPSVVLVDGILSQKTYPGAPNFRSIHTGDKAERVWLISLDSAICVDQDKVEPDINPEKRDLKTIQLVLSADAYSHYKDLVGKRVVASGMLFGAHTGHHHTPVLMTVQTLRKAK